MRRRRAAAAMIQTGAERSSPSSREGRGHRVTVSSRAIARGGSGPEELHEARLDLLVALLQLLGIDEEELELAELRPVGGILDLGVPGVEAFGIREHLLDLAAEEEVREELGRVRMGREGGDGGGRDDKRHALLGVDDLHRVSLLLDLVEGI